MSRKMKDSGIEWLGEIPEDWETIRVKNLFNVSRGRVISKLETTDDGEYPVYSSQTENDGIFGYIDTYDYFGEALTWTTDGEKAGTVFYRNGKYNCTNICGILQRKQDSIFKTDIKYLFYAIRMVSEENKRPDTNGHKIMSNEMEKLSIPITNYDEQVKIGLTLDKKTQQIENIKNTITEEIETLENYKKSLITEAVTKGLDKNVEMKDSGIEWIGEIPKHWNLKTIKSLTIKSERGTSPSYVDDSTQAKVVNQATFSQGFFDKSNIKFSKIPASQSKGLLQKEDVLIASTGGGVLGKTHYFIENEEYVADGHVTVLRTNPIVQISKILYYIFSVNYELINGLLAKGSTNQTELQSEWLKNFKVPYSPIDEQKAIVSYLDEKTKLIDETISLKQKQLESLEEYKKSLIYEYVTGKKEV